MAKKDIEIEDLQMNATDVLVGALRSAVATASTGLQIAPLYSSLITELITGFIPNQRIDRFERFLIQLDKVLGDFESEFIKKRWQEPGVIALIEDGIHQAVRAVTEERLRYIALVIKNGIKAEDIEILIAKTVLDLLNQLENIEIIILQSYSFADNKAEEDFKRTHPLIFANLESAQSDEGLIPPTIIKHYYAHLLNLQLITKTERNTTGLTDLGVLLLKSLDFEVSAQAYRFQSDGDRVARNVLLAAQP